MTEPIGYAHIENLGFMPAEIFKDWSALRATPTDLAHWKPIVWATEPETRHTCLGVLPVDTNTIDLLDKALTDQRDRHAESLRRIYATIEVDHAELSRMRQLRKALARGVGVSLADQLNDLARLIDPSLEEY